MTQRCGPDGPDPALCEILNRILTEALDTHARAAAYIGVIELAAGEDKGSEKLAKEMSDEADKYFKEATEAFACTLSKSPLEQVPAHHAQGPAAAVYLPDVPELTPPRLTGEATLKEFKQWLLQWQAHYDALILNQAPWRIQHETLFRLLDPVLTQALRAIAAPGMPVPLQELDGVGDIERPSLIKHLTRIVEGRQSLVTRRIAFMREAHKPGTNWLDWFRTLPDLAEAADIESMTVDDWMVVKGISGCANIKLREKFLALDNPTRQQLETIGAEHIATQRARRSHAGR